MRDRMFGLFFGCALLGTFTFGFATGKAMQGVSDYKIAQVNRVVKVDSANMTIVAKNP
jgi:hypothetical protein